MSTPTQKTNHIQRLVKAVNMVLTGAQALRDVYNEAQSTSPGLGYVQGGANALVDNDFTVAGSPCMSSDYNTILEFVQVLEMLANTPGIANLIGSIQSLIQSAGTQSGNSIWQQFRLLSK